MPKLIKRNDKSHIGGMDTVQDFRADTFPASKCLLLRNIFPGDPPTPRNGCQDIMVDVAALGYNDQHTLFKPPALITKDANGNLYAFVYAIGETGGIYYTLECWDVTSGTRYNVFSGKWDEYAYFGLLNIYGAILSFRNIASTESYIGNAAGHKHKIIEYFDSLAAWQARDLNITKYVELGTVTCVDRSAGLTSGLWVSYTGTYVRRDRFNDTDAFDASYTSFVGLPQSTNIYTPGMNEGFESTDYRQTILLDSTVDTEYGDSTTELSVNEVIEDSVYRYEWSGTGTDPGFENIVANSWIQITGDNFFAVNAGIFKVKESGAGYLEVYNTSGEEQAPFLMGADGLIRERYCATHVAIPGQSDIDDAVAQGATHLRLWRTDHAATEAVAEGLTHKFVIDIPLYGTEYDSYRSQGYYVDSLSRNALDGEPNFLTATNYTEAPLGRFACYNAFRLFLGGGTKRGRWYYTEVPGGDGGTTLADLFPKKYLSWFKPITYYIDCDPDDGQVDTGCAVLRDDCYFFKEKKTFVLHNGDVTRAPDCVSEHIGCVFPNTIVVANLPRLGEFIFFVSAEGPCVIQPGGTLTLLSQFSINELWPEGELLNKTNGELMTERVREKVHAKVYQNTIFVLYGDSEDENANNPLTENKIFGYYEGADKPFRGCLEINFEDFYIFWQVVSRANLITGTHTVFKNPFVTTTATVEAAAKNHSTARTQPLSAGSVEATTKIHGTARIQPHIKLSAEAAGKTHSPYTGSYIYDNFAAGVDSWWDSEFKTNWTRTELPPASGEYAMIRGSDGIDLLTPANNLTDGFTFEAGMICGGTNLGPNYSIHFNVVDSTGTEAYAIWWYLLTGSFTWKEYSVTKNSTTETYSAYKEIKIKIERPAGSTSVYGYYDVGAGWVQFAYVGTLAGPVGIKLDGCHEHGFSYLDLWAGAGLPNP